MPAATIMLNKDEASQQALPEANCRSLEAEFQLLCLPSLLPADHRKHNCNANLVEIEVKLREAQCHDALDKIRSLQRGRLSFIGFRNRNIRGQNPNTRAKDTLDRLEDKTKAMAVKYMAARDALLALRGPGRWEQELRPLVHGDLTTPDGQEISIEIPGDTVGPDGRTLSKKQRTAERLGLGQGKKTVSWIWTTTGAIGDGDDAVLHEGKQPSIRHDFQLFTDIQRYGLNGRKPVHGACDGRKRSVCSKKRCEGFRKPWSGKQHGGMIGGLDGMLWMSQHGKEYGHMRAGRQASRELFMHVLHVCGTSHGCL